VEVGERVRCDSFLDTLNFGRRILKETVLERPPRSCGHIQPIRHGGANERLQRLFINLVALMEIDGTPGVAFEAGVEEA
jgi:hypothetical protein